MAAQQMTISRFSIMTRLTPKALRLYDQKGLLIPAIKDFTTGYRYYAVEQIERGLTIKYLGSLGFSLAEIGDLLKASEDGKHQDVSNQLNRKLKEIQSEIQRLKEIEDILKGTKGLDSLFPHTTPPIIKEIPAIRVICKRKKGTYSQTIGELIGYLFRQIEKRENRENFVTVTGPTIFIGHDEEYMEENADIEVAIPITGRICVDEDVQVKTLEGGKFLSTIYTGPYDNIGEGHDCIIHYCLKHQLKTEGPQRELYLTHPGEKPPHEYKTEIMVKII
jgi:DNA-binding transcriptional MerR regulator